jgi:MtaA/CmuA family methyltransferase
MNGYQRIRAAIDGVWPDRPPVMLHNFMMAAREAGISMAQFRRDPRALARAFIESAERYEVDGILVDVDTATLAGALGVPVDLPDDAPARCAGARLASLDEVAGLEAPRVGDYWGVQVWLEGVRLLRAHFRDELFWRGNCDHAPYALASAMRTPEAWMMDLMDPASQEAARRLLDYCAEATSQFVTLMAAAGAHMVSNGDSPAGPELVSPRIYREFALPYEKRIVELAHRLGLPYFLHICGKTDRILEDMLETGADGLELDYKTDARLAHDLMKDRAVFVGNLDPSGVLALGTPALVEAKTRELVALFRDTPRFILNAGCAIPATTPEENIRAIIRASRQASAG